MFFPPPPELPLAHKAPLCQLLRRFPYPQKDSLVRGMQAGFQAHFPPV